MDRKQSKKLESMDMKKLGLTLLITTAAITGCSSTPNEREPIEFNSNNSFALNIANQTSLTSGGGISARSPLRDFTQEEVDEVKANVHINYGSASKVLGALSVLTLNFNGLIDIAGGYAADFGNSNHQATKPRWLIALDKNDFPNKEAAYSYAHEAVVNASIKVLEQYGSVIRKVNEKSSSQYFEVDVEGKRSVVGLVSSLKPQVNVQEGKFFASQTENGVDSYLIGFDNKVYSSFDNIPVISVANSVIEKLNVNEDDFYRDISKNLPENFYLYMPSFPKFTAYNKHYTDLDSIVPSIYNGGERFEFIKP